MDELQVMAVCTQQISLLTSPDARSRVCAYLLDRFKPPVPEPVKPPPDESQSQKIRDLQIGFARLHLPTFALNRLRRALIDYVRHGYNAGAFEPHGVFLSFDEWANYHQETRGRDLSQIGGEATHEKIMASLDAWLSGLNEPADRTKAIKALQYGIENNLLLSTRVLHALLNGLARHAEEGWLRDAFEIDGRIMTFDEWVNHHESTNGKHLYGIRGMGEAADTELLHAIGFYLDERRIENAKAKEREGRTTEAATAAAG